MKNQVENVFQSKHLKIIAAMTVATFITVPLVDYQFKVLAKEAFTHDGTVDTDALSAFMGVFTTVTGLIALVMQLGLTSRILERFGVAVSLLVLPVTLLVGVLGMIFNIGSAFHNAVLGKGAENAFRYSIYDGTMQVIYAPVPNHMRGRAKTFVDGILKPAAGGIAGAAMVAIVGPLRLPVMSLAVFALALIVAWIGLILLIRREYVNELLATLRRRRLDFSAKLVIEDDATVAVLRRTLRSAEPAEVGHALELARRVRGHDLTQEAVALLTHPAPDLRRRAIELLATSGAAAPAERVLAHFTDPSEEVQAAAVRTYCLLTGGQGVRAVTGMLESVSPEVRGAAVAGLIKSGGLEGVLIAAEHLKAMQAATDERVRFAAACVLNEIAVRSYFQPVLTLLRDPSVRVQIAAIQAAGEMRAPELVPALVYKLAQRETARASALALAAYGATIVETLGKVLAQERESAALRRQVPRILERTATQRALEILLQCIGTTDGETRREIARAAGRLRDTLGVVVDEAPTRKVLTDELFEHYQSLAALDDLRPITGQGAPDLLRDALEERLKRSLERIFRLLSILYPLKAIDLVHANLRSATSTTRANAIEVLDNLLDQDDKRRILPLVEDQGAARVLAAGADLFAIQRRAPAEWVHLFLDGTDTWLVVAALHAAAELGLREGRASAERLYGHREPIVRETAVRTLAVLCDAREFLVLIERNADEEDPMVRAAIAFYADAARRVLGKAPNVAGRVRAGAGEFSVEST